MLLNYYKNTNLCSTSSVKKHFFIFVNEVFVVLTIKRVLKSILINNPMLSKINSSV